MNSFDIDLSHNSKYILHITLLPINVEFKYSLIFNELFISFWMKTRSGNIVPGASKYMLGQSHIFIQQYITDKLILSGNTIITIHDMDIISLFVNNIYSLWGTKWIDDEKYKAFNLFNTYSVTWDNDNINIFYRNFSKNDFLTSNNKKSIIKEIKLQESKGIVLNGENGYNLIHDIVIQHSMGAVK